MKPAGAAAAAVATAAALHGIPGLAWLGPLRLRLLPEIAGLGRPGHLALTFDDGPDPAGTPLVLDILDRLGWHATFFMLGSQVARHPKLAAEVLAAGHEIGVHGYLHRYALVRTPAAARHDLTRAVDEVENATGKRPTWYRPPYGVFAAGSLLAARYLALTPVLWSTWGKDWRADATPASIVAQLRRGPLSGGTALLHDSDIDSAPLSWRATSLALPLLRDELDRIGVTRVGTLSDHGIGTT